MRRPWSWVLAARNPTVVVFRDREVVVPDRELVGTTWEVHGFIDGDTAMSMLLPGEPGTLLVQDDGWVTGSGGCNGFGHSQGGDPELGIRHRVEGDRITFTGDAVSTLVACEGAEEYVARYWAVLTGTATWSIEADRLTVLAQDGRGVMYRAAGG